jgi:Cysteine-rich domain
MHTSETPLRIALFITCLADAMFPDVGRATATLLSRLGHEVEFPPDQTCCGQMHVNTGCQRRALPMVERFAEVFAPYDAVVAPSGSCVGSVRHQHRLVAQRFGTPIWSAGSTRSPAGPTSCRSCSGSNSSSRRRASAGSRRILSSCIRRLGPQRMQFA